MIRLEGTGRPADEREDVRQRQLAHKAADNMLTAVTTSAHHGHAPNGASNVLSGALPAMRAQSHKSDAQTAADRLAALPPRIAGLHALPLAGRELLAVVARKQERAGGAVPFTVHDAASALGVSEAKAGDLLRGLFAAGVLIRAAGALGPAGVRVAL